MAIKHKKVTGQADPPDGRVGGAAWDDDHTAAVVISDSDPGAIGAGNLWLESNLFGNTGYGRLWVRNGADSGWLHGGPAGVADGTSTLVSSPDDYSELFLANDGGVSYLNGPTGTGLSFGQYVYVGSSAGPALIGGTADPSAGAGIAAPLASHYMRQNGTAGELWVKTGTADTAWTKVV